MGNNISNNVRKKVYSKYDGRCAYCGCKMKYYSFTIDHINPKRRGDKVELRGTDEIHNLNPCCGSCNSSKSTFSIEKWRIELSLKYDRLIRDSSPFRIISRFNLIKKTKNYVIFYFEKHEPKY